MNKSPNHKKDRNVKAVSPAISTVILTSTIVVMMIVALAFANSMLSSKNAESDFNSAKQFMQTIGLQIDDVAWMIGRTETIHYSTNLGEVSVLPSTLIYTFSFRDEPDPWQNISVPVAILLFNVHLSEYSVYNGYYEAIFPSSTSTFVQGGPSTPAIRVFAVEKVPMGDGGFIRIVVAPTIRWLDSTIDDQFYTNLYLPVLTLGSAPRLTQSVTVNGTGYTRQEIFVTDVKITVDFPRNNQGFDNSFFNFPSCNQTILTSKDSVFVFHEGEVTMALGV